MLGDLFEKLWEGFNFKVRDIFILILIILLGFTLMNIYEITASTNLTVTIMDQRYLIDVEEGAFAVLSTLQKNNIVEPNEILEFLANKPAGRSDLKKGLSNEDIYSRLVNVYDNLAKNAKIALLD